MSSFSDPLDVRRVGSSHIVLLRDMTAYVDRQGTRSHYTARRGFRSDGASIPLPVRFLAGHPFGESLRAAVIHDVCYSTHPCSRADADYAMFVLSGVEGVSLFRRCIIWAALRLGGWWAWRSSPQIPDRIVNAQVLEQGGPEA